MPPRTLKIADRLPKLAALAFRKYAADLHRYVGRRIREADSVPDLTQEIFERFLGVRDAEAVRNPQAYLFGIASHVLREKHYRDDRSLVSFDSDAVDAADESLAHAWPDDNAERLSLQEELRAALLYEGLPGEVAHDLAHQ